MSDVAQAFLVPRISPRLDMGALLSGLLVWDRVLVPDPFFFHGTSDGLRELVERLEDHGACGFVELPDPPPWPPPRDAMDEAVRGIVPSDRHRGAPALAELGAYMTTAIASSWQAQAIQISLATCNRIHAAPLTSGWVSHLAASLPDAEAAPNVRQGRLITAAVDRVAVAPGTSIAEILRFRDDHQAIRGRFRAALGDLSESLARDAPPAAVLEEANAVVANRVTPALAELERALSDRRITYLWRTMLAGSAVAGAPAAAGVVTAGAATFVTHSLQYAFNRQRLISDHPFGLLYEMRRGFTIAQQARPFSGLQPITDPCAEIRSLWLQAVSGAVQSIVEHASSADSGSFDKDILAQIARKMSAGFDSVDH